MKFRQLMRVTEDKYNRLLTSLISLYFISPFLVDRPIGDLIVFFFFSLSLITLIYQIDRSKFALRFNVGVLYPAIFIARLVGLQNGR
jgi:hypothetical protein